MDKESADQVFNKQEGDIPTPEINPDFTGPLALHKALKALDIESLEKEHREHISNGGNKTQRSKSIKALNVLKGLKRNEMTPEKLMINNVPVIPANFRPFSVAGDTYIAGDANELYRDLINVKKSYEELAEVLGDETGGEKLGLYDAVKAVYGLGEAVDPKTRSRGVSGFLKKITGTNPKVGWLQGKMIGKTQDTVGRSVIGIDPSLSLNEIGIPESIAWKVYAPYIQRRMVKMGFSPVLALKGVKDRNKDAKRALEVEMRERPVVYSRAPSWHKYNVIAGKPKLIEGDSIKINSLVTTGMNADFDGDTLNIHVPSTPEAVKEAHEVLMPSKMLFSTRDTDKVVPLPKQEMILGLYTANKDSTGNAFDFPSQEEAVKAIRSGRVGLSDEITINGQSM